MTTVATINRLATLWQGGTLCSLATPTLIKRLKAPTEDSKGEH